MNISRNFNSLSRLLHPTRCHVQPRLLSSMQQKIKKENLTKSLCLRQVEHLQPQHSKPLVLFFPWLMAPQKAIDRYCELYHGRGWDVLTITGSVKHFMWPPSTSVITKQLIELLSSDAHSLRPLVIQGMSVGAYLYTVMLMDVEKDQKAFNSISPRIRAHIFDSIVIGSLEHMATGVARALTSSTLAQRMITSSTSAYFALTKKHTVEFYKEAVAAFYNNPLGGPVLYFYSHSDPMCDPEAMDSLVNSMRQSGRFDVTIKSWAQSPHAGHLRVHREEYLQTFDAFLAKMNI